MEKSVWKSITRCQVRSLNIDPRVLYGSGRVLSSTVQTLDREFETLFSAAFISSRVIRELRQADLSFKEYFKMSETRSSSLENGKF
jgi:hypothetical protein